MWAWNRSPFAKSRSCHWTSRPDRGLGALFQRLRCPRASGFRSSARTVGPVNRDGPGRFCRSSGDRRLLPGSDGQQPGQWDCPRAKRRRRGLPANRTVLVDQMDGAYPAAEAPHRPAPDGGELLCLQRRTFLRAPASAVSRPLGGWVASWCRRRLLACNGSPGCSECRSGGMDCTITPTVSYNTRRHWRLQTVRRCLVMLSPASSAGGRPAQMRAICQWPRLPGEP
jgi:hypothetical protein